MIAVTGVLGFIGFNMMKRLSGSDRKNVSVGVDHPICESKLNNLREISGITLLSHDQFLNEIFAKRLAPSTIIHLGACSSTTETNWDYLRENNLEYSQKLWKWCAENQARFIYASSAATYGDGANGFDDEQDISKLHPLNLYGKSKHDFDLWVEQQQRQSGPKPRQCVGLKFFNVFGPGEGHKGRMASMVFHAFNQIQSSGRVKLFKSHRPDFSDGGQLRDFIYVGEVVDVIQQFIDNPEISGLFNLGTGKARSFRDLIEAVFSALGREPMIDYIPMPADIRDKYQYFTEATIRKLQAVGIHLPNVSLEEAVRDYVIWLEKSQVAPVPAVA